MRAWDKDLRVYIQAGSVWGDTPAGSTAPQLIKGFRASSAPHLHLICTFVCLSRTCMPFDAERGVCV